jgi:hypothetical protein
MKRWILPSLIVVAVISTGLAVWLDIPFWPALLIAVCAIALKAGSRV